MIWANDIASRHSILKSQALLWAHLKTFQAQFKRMPSTCQAASFTWSLLSIIMLSLVWVQGLSVVWMREYWCCGQTCGPVLAGCLYSVPRKPHHLPTMGPPVPRTSHTQNAVSRPLTKLISNITPDNHSPLRETRPTIHHPASVASGNWHPSPLVRVH